MPPEKYRNSQPQHSTIHSCIIINAFTTKAIYSISINFRALILVLEFYFQAENCAVYAFPSVKIIYLNIYSFCKLYMINSIPGIKTTFFTE